VLFTECGWKETTKGVGNTNALNFQFIIASQRVTVFVSLEI
jgi:hypothetical protein